MRPRGQTPRMRTHDPYAVDRTHGFNEAAGADPADASDNIEGAKGIGPLQ